MVSSENKQKHLIGVVRDMPRHPIEPQERDLRAHGCTQIIKLGPDWSSWIEVLNQLRAGEGIMVRHLHLLPPPRLSTADSRRRFMFKCLRDLRERGNTWFETSTSTLCTDEPRKLKALEDAVEYITKQAHGLARRQAQKNGKRGGAVAAEFSPEALRKAFDTYTDPRLTGDALDVALAAIKSESHPKTGFSKERCYRLFGGRTVAKFNDGRK